MAVADYNSPYTGAMLDETIRKVTGNDLHSYVEVFRDESGSTTEVNINSLPTGPNGLRTGLYTIAYGQGTLAAGNVSTSTILVTNISSNAAGSGHGSLSVDGGTGDYSIHATRTEYEGGAKVFKALYDSLNVTANFGVIGTPLNILIIRRQDTLA